MLRRMSFCGVSDLRTTKSLRSTQLNAVWCLRCLLGALQIVNRSNFTSFHPHAGVGMDRLKAELLRLRGELNVAQKKVCVFVVCELPTLFALIATDLLHVDPDQ